MTTEQLSLLFKKYKNEFAKFERISALDKVCNSPDACAMVLLSERFNLDDDAIGYTRDEMIYFRGPEGIEPDWSLSEDDVLFLSRCGVWYDEDEDTLCKVAV